jgi:hypothetical protein
MTKAHLRNTKHDERWWGNDKKTMSTKNREIATTNNSKEGYQKATLKTPLQVLSWRGIFVSWGKRGHERNIEGTKDDIKRH